MKRSTNRLILAATTAKPNRMNTKLNATYPGFVSSAWLFWFKINIFKNRYFFLVFRLLIFISFFFLVLKFNYFCKVIPVKQHNRRNQL